MHNCFSVLPLKFIHYGAVSCFSVNAKNKKMQILSGLCKFVHIARFEMSFFNLTLCLAYHLLLGKKHLAFFAKLQFPVKTLG